MTGILTNSGTKEILTRLKARIDVKFTQAVLALYPVDTILFTPSADYDPNECIGGTWTRSDTWTDLTSGGFYPRMMSADDEIDSAVTMEGHVYYQCLPAHTHTVSDCPTVSGSVTLSAGLTSALKYTGGSAEVAPKTYYTDASGSGHSDTVIDFRPTYIAMYAWRRTA